MSYRKTLSRALGVVVAASLHAPLNATPFTGTVTSYYLHYDGQLLPFEIPINGAMVNTGPVSFSLDLSAPDQQVSIYNFDAMKVEDHIDLLMTSPVLQSFGYPAQRIHVDEVGTIDQIIPADVPPDVTSDVTLSLSLHGDGTFGPGQLFEDWTYSNVNIRVDNRKMSVRGDNNKVETKDSGGQESNVEGTVTPGMVKPAPTPATPNPTPVPTHGGSGSARLGQNPLPEPSTFGFLTVGGIALFLYKARVKRRQLKP